MGEVFGAEGDLNNPSKQSAITKGLNYIYDKAWYGYHSFHLWKGGEAAKYDKTKFENVLKDVLGEDELMCDKNKKEPNKPFVAVLSILNNNPDQVIPLLLRN